MQQLTLFSNHPSTSRRRPTRRTKNNYSRQPRIANWDLWSHESEVGKEMALFFLDIRNFTPLVERHEASDVIHFVKKLFSKFQNIIRIHHGQVIETSGDGFYAAFGLDSGLHDAINDAVRAGMGILEALKQINAASLEQRLQQRIDVGIGVHAGKVATGNFLLGGRDHLVVMGYPVNIASRIQSATREFNNNFIISSDVFHEVRQYLGNAVRVKANLKGVPEAMELFLIGKPYTS